MFFPDARVTPCAIKLGFDHPGPVDRKLNVERMGVPGSWRSSINACPGLKRLRRLFDHLAISGDSDSAFHACNGVGFRKYAHFGAQFSRPAFLLFTLQNVDYSNIQQNSLLTCSLHFGQAGLSPARFDYKVSNFIQKISSLSKLLLARYTEGQFEEPNALIGHVRDCEGLEWATTLGYSAIREIYRVKRKSPTEIIGEYVKLQVSNLIVISEVEKLKFLKNFNCRNFLKYLFFTDVHGGPSRQWWNQRTYDGFKIRLI